MLTSRLDTFPTDLLHVYNQSSAVDGCAAFDYYLDNINTLVGSCKADLTQVSRLLQCSAVSYNWNKLVNDDICGYLFDGVYIVSIVSYLAAGSLLAVVCTAAVLHHHFGEAWTIGDDSNLPLPNDSNVHFVSQKLGLIRFQDSDVIEV